MRFCFSIQLGNVERTSRAQNLARLWDRSTQMPWPQPGSPGGRWLELQVCSMLVVGKVLHFRTTRLRGGKLTFWANSKMLAFVPSTSWRWWDLLIWGSLFEETTAGEALDSSSLLPCIFLHPYIEPGPGSVAEKEKMDLDTRSCRRNLLSFHHPAEIQGAGCSYGKSSVLPKRTGSSFLNLAPNYRSAEQNVDPRKMDWLCVLVRHWNCS